ncbi:SDR family NAD(P)-dependent oxidoreductase [Cochlodiniinecator piscidefendens]|uniref:SDR family NAD(P)-dependent oxidoreductase n=1 Tax=Cochlodiniinecator piscidefendens TaxID=2715756 RepID=UPI0014073F97|nr:SDR family oxidoreductase [Cochlodiniinecator piscidefendens]
MTRGVSTIITGAASGIGAALALTCSKPGAQLTLHTRKSETALNAIANQARDRGAEVETILGDLSEPGTAAAIVAAHAARFGQLDALVANAGFPLLKSLNEMQPDDISYAFLGNTQSFFELVQSAKHLLSQAPHPRIVAVGSFTSHVFRTDMPQFPASAASKGAIEVAVRSLSLALAKDSITVNCVVPGYIEKDKGTGDALSPNVLDEITRKIPLGRLGKPEDVSQAIRFLLSQDAGYITGQILHVNGGLI